MMARTIATMKWLAVHFGFEFNGKASQTHEAMRAQFVRNCPWTTVVMKASLPSCFMSEFAELIDWSLVARHQTQAMTPEFIREHAGHFSMGDIYAIMGRCDNEPLLQAALTHMTTQLESQRAQLGAQAQ